MRHWYVARVEKIEGDRIWVRYDGWSDSDNEWITRADAPTRIAAFFTVCNAAKRRLGGLAFDLSAAIALKVSVGHGVTRHLISGTRGSTSCCNRCQSRCLFISSCDVLRHVSWSKHRHPRVTQVCSVDIDNNEG